MTATAFPPSWPQQFPRAKANEKSRFQTTLANALKNVQKSLQLFAQDSNKKLEGIVISSNVTLGVQRPDDPGVAVWFVWDGLQLCIAVDRYATVEANLQAIHHILEARRVELRHGTLALVRATFQGFLALPAPKDKRTWREVLDVPLMLSKDLAFIKTKFQEKARANHPDRGGSDAKMAEINVAWQEAQKEVGRG